MSRTWKMTRSGIFHPILATHFKDNINKLEPFSKGAIRIFNNL
jgi:hypothetical protein